MSSSSPYHIRQSLNQRKKSLSHSFESNLLVPEYASFDSVRTDLSIGSKDVIIADQWVVLGRIGEGSFGEVFEAEDVDSGRRYAVKREPIKMRNPQIRHEHIIYDVLAGGVGIPQCHWYGQHDDFDCIVIDLLGMNVNQLKDFVVKLPLEVVVDFGCQMVTMMEHIHKRGLVYRDIKPDNFLFASDYTLPEPEMVEGASYRHPVCDEIFKGWGLSSPPKLYLVDFGLTTWWKNPETDKAYPETKKDYRNKAGTARYASLHVHRGKPHARRDDIESIGYLLLDMLFGSLPWTGIQAKNSRAGWDRMKQIKEDTFMSDICAGQPQGILEFIEYSKKIRFLEEPDYDLLRQFLQGSLEAGPYSKPVVSPFGAHAEKAWLKDVDRCRPRHRKPSYQDPGIFQMDDLAHALPELKPNSPLKRNRRTSKDLGRPERPRSSRKKKQVGWNSHKHDKEPWAPAVDWAVPSEKPEEIQWNEEQPSWGNPPPQTDWADTVNKPWE
ncbi:kinase-like domain-containing protein [Sporodiniella umbellata]|nr:kinase-like domain-containing protein [Sporodiniella umbellata]